LSNFSTAIGDRAIAAHLSSVALGANAATTRDNQIVLGTVNETITAPGLPSASSLAAQGAIHGIVTTDANGNLASDGGALQASLDTNTSNIASNAASITNNTANIRITRRISHPTQPQ